MGLFAKFNRRLRSPQSPGVPPSAPTAAPLSPPVSGSSATAKSLAALEQEILAQYQPIQRPRSPSSRPRRRWTGKWLGLAILVAVPTGILWFVNLPYPPIRRPIADNAPLLLLPSYISLDHHYREAIDQVEQAKQFIDQAKSPADLDAGAQAVAQAKTHLDALPLWLWGELSSYGGWWWRGHLSYAGFNAARADIGRLEAKTRQEQQGQADLTEAEQALILAKEQYQQAQTPAAQLTAIAAWQTAIARFDQMPAQTLASRIAQQKIVVYRQELQDTAGLAANNQAVSTYMEIARQYGARAAQASQNPPHSVTEWQRVETLWQGAIAQLALVPQTDLVGYAAAQTLKAEYEDNLSQIQVRRQQEAAAAQLLQSVHQRIETLLASSDYADRGELISQIRGVITQLEQIDAGTTAYPEAQMLLLQAQNKLSQAQAEGAN